MSLWEILRTATRSLSLNRLRTGLSILGIVIGVASVIALVSLGSGAQRQVTSRIESLGSNLITISPAATRGRGGLVSRSENNRFTLELAGEIRKAAPALKRVVPQEAVSGLLVAEGNNLRATVLGVTPEYPEIVNYRVLAGRFLRGWDLDESAHTMVLGSEVAKTLFGRSVPIGRTVTASLNGRRLRFTVVGVMDAKGQVLFSNFDNQVYVPVTTVLHRVDSTDSVSGYLAEAAGPEQADAAVGEVSYFLTRRLGDAEGFRVLSQQSILTTLNSALGTFTILLGTIAGISLLVGGIGIMNIMLVSVTERTREIGVRKALGARRRDLRAQFLAEAVVLSVTGGIIGLFMGWAASIVIARYAGWATVISLPAVFLALGFSIAVGLVFGVYPASRAARLDPVVALRYE